MAFGGQRKYFRRSISPVACERKPGVPKFLILRFSSIGDIVLTTPVIRGLKQQVPNAEVHFLTKSAFEPVLKHNPYIDKLYTFSENPDECLKELADEKFDAIIDLHHNQRSFWVKRKLRSTSTFSFRKLNIEKWLLVNFKINRLPDLHIVDRYLETVQSLGVKNDGKGLDYFLSENDRSVAERLPESHSKSYVAVAIGAQHGTKRLPVEKLIGICRQLQQPVILLGGKEDAENGKRIAEASGAHVLNGCGQFSLNESAAIVASAHSVLTHDTGLMHIAAAFKRPIVSVWGNTVPQFGMTPYYGDAKIPNRIFEVDGLACRPCSKIGFNGCPKKHFRCMYLQDENAIAEAVNRPVL
ncbi:MAG: hypothetical protein RIQ47_497 [Bacteroidota bacterium]|jgi:heptosyltransferase-2